MFRRLIDIVPSLVVTLASLALFVFVAYGEANRVYPQLRLERIGALGEVMRLPLNLFAQSGLPLREFIGFGPRAQTVLPIDSALRSVTLIDDLGQVVFHGSVSADGRGGAASPQPGQGGARPAADEPEAAAGRGVDVSIGARGPVEDLLPGFARAGPSIFELPGSRVARTVEHYYVAMPVQGKFGTVGELVLAVEAGTVAAPVDRAFEQVAAATLVVFAAFALFQIIAAFRWSLGGRKALTIAFVSAFFVTAAVITTALFLLYSAGVQGKARGLAQSIAERLSVATEIGVDPVELRGLEGVFRSYVESYPDISDVALVVGSRIVMHSDPDRVGERYMAGFNTYTFDFPLRQAAGGERVLVSVAVPISVVLERIWRHGKNFAVLFLACGLIAWNFLAIGHRFRGGADPAADRRADGGDAVAAPGGAARSEAQLLLVRPAYFLAIFADALAISFLPQYAAGLAVEAGWSAAWASLPFIVFFVGLTGALLPASRAAERGRVKLLFLLGAAAVAVSFLVVATQPGFLALVLARGLAGAGQGVLLIAMQTFGLALVPADRRTEAVAIQIQGYNGGVIAGAAIGGLLVAFAPATGVFAVAAGVAVATALYVVTLLKDIAPATAAAPAPAAAALPAAAAESSGGHLIEDVRASLSDPEFLRVLFLVGIMSKLILAGVVMFAAPLTLSERGYLPEDIGQIVMFFAIGTLATATYAARLVDRRRGARPMLSLGGLISGCGVLLFSLAVMAPPDGGPGPLLAVPFLATALAIGGLTLVGVAQGLVAAPLVTQVASTPVALRRGSVRIAGLYRLLERAGHIGGPLIVSRALWFTGGHPSALAAIGVVAIALSGLYFLSSSSRRPVSGLESSG